MRFPLDFVPRSALLRSIPLVQCPAEEKNEGMPLNCYDLTLFIGDEFYRLEPPDAFPMP